MDVYEKTKRLSDMDFKQIIGVKRNTFNDMVQVLKEAYAEKHRKGGRPPKLSIEAQLIMTLKYLRQYPTQLELAYEFEVGEATVHDTIVWVENTLVKDDKFKLPGKKVLLEENNIEVILVDVTESPIERPKKNKEGTIRVKRNATIKSQVIVDKATGFILCVAQCCGKTHDFKLFCDTIGSRIAKRIPVLTDSGYQGIKKFHANSKTPIKKTKGGVLSSFDKQENLSISRNRILIENINAKIKVFKIMADKYRNRRSRHDLRLNLICGCINADSRI